MADPPPTLAALGQTEAFKLGENDWEQYTESLEYYFVANGTTENAQIVAVFI